MNNKKNRKCKQCMKKLTGEMISDPDLCLFCVIDNHAKTFGKKNK